MRMMAILLLSIIILVACEGKKSASPENSFSSSHTSIKYAEGFTVQYQGKHKLVEVKPDRIVLLDEDGVTEYVWTRESR
jgi:ABC-type enterochelin transport system substrate-binding protein